VAGHVILITGCSSGIGRAAALEAAGRGHRVFATARDLGSLSGLPASPNLETLSLDVTDAASIRRAVESLTAKAGRLDAVVNNAGFAQYGAVEDVSAEAWRRQYEVNVFGAVEVLRAALPAMRRSGGGTVVNVSSVGGKVSIPFAAPYCSSKHALEAISDALRVELFPFGIRVVVIEAGPVTTRFDERARAEVAPLLDRPGPYAPFYPAAKRAMETDFARGPVPPERVARVIVDAIEARRPRTRYGITRMARSLIFLRRILSDRWFDRQMRKALKLPDRA
jgi:NAD(P)-dependent dehydrogenase (short-subunit alcohol dehydrogenase family)